MVDEIGGTNDPFLAYVLARTCALVPKSVADPPRTVAWAEKAVAAQPNAAGIFTSWGWRCIARATTRRRSPG